jgi:uncharacterized protein
MRYLFIIIAIWLVVMILRHFLQQGQRRREQLPPTTDTVKCAYCGLHLPKNDAVHAGGEWYCSEKHRLEDQADGPD